MKKLLLPLILLAFAACATAPQTPLAAQTVVKPSFNVDAYALVAIQYHAPNVIAGVNLYGPVPKEQQCHEGGAAYLTQIPQYIPKTDRAAATCLEIKFTGPAAGGQTVLQPFTGTPIAYAIVPIEYDGSGHFVGMGVGDEPRQAIPGGQTATECTARADEIRTSSYGDGRVPAGASLIVYCVGIPRLDVLWQNSGDDSSVMNKPCPSYPFVGAGPCQIATARWSDVSL